MNAISRYFSRHLQALLSAFARLLKRPFGSLLSVLVIAMALALPASLWLLVKNAQSVAGDVTESIELAVYFKLEAPLERAEELARAAVSRADVAEAVVVSADEGLEEFRQFSGFGPALDALEGNPLPHVLTVRPKADYATPEGVESLRRYLAAAAEVETVQVDGEWVRRLAALLDLLRSVLLSLAAVLGAGVLVLIGNTIRFEIGTRRAEIEVIKLVGGSNAFVRRPFLYEGVVFGLLGGLIAIGIVALVIVSLAPAVERLAVLYGGGFVLTGATILEALALVGAGTLLGWLGAWLGAARLIARIEPRD